MKKLFKRLVAYLIDMMVILLLAQSISGIPQINGQLDKYNKYYDKYMDLYGDYVSFYGDLNKYYEDESLSEEEYNSLIEAHEGYANVLNEYYIDGEISSSNYEELTKRIYDDYNKEYENVYFKIEKNSIVYFVVYLVAVLLYFVGFNKYTNGQTLGKKLMRLKIVNSKDQDKNVSVLSYIIRAIILYQPIYYIVKLIGVSFLSIDTYYSVTRLVYDIHSYLEMLVIIMVMMRLDGRGPHDFLAGTRVMLYDKNGNEIKDKQDKISKKIDELKNAGKEVVDAEVVEEKELDAEVIKPKKKTTVRKKSKKVNKKESAK